MRRKYKKLIIISSTIAGLICAYLVVSYTITQRFQKYLLQIPEEGTIIDVYCFGSDYPEFNHEQKGKLIELIEGNVRLSKLKPYSVPFSSDVTTYYIFVRGADYSFTLYVSNVEPENCYIAGDKLEYYVTGGEIIADYLDECQQG